MGMQEAGQALTCSLGLVAELPAARGGHTCPAGLIFPIKRKGLRGRKGISMLFGHAEDSNFPRRRKAEQKVERRGV